MPQYVPLSPGRHAGKSWRRFQDFAFTRSRAVAPVFVAEAMVAAGAMPLAFLQEGDSYVLCALLSLPPGRNAFVAPHTGKWIGSYVPAMFRVHPFQFIRPSRQAEPILCIDEEAGLSDGAAGDEALFDAEGKPTKATQAAASNAATVEQNREHTAKATAALVEAGLLVPWELTLTVDRTKRGVAGLFHVHYGRLESLSSEALVKLHETQALGMAYAQLVSEGRVGDLQALTTQLEGSLTVADARKMTGLESLDSVFGVSSDGNLKFGS